MGVIPDRAKNSFSPFSSPLSAAVDSSTLTPDPIVQTTGPEQASKPIIPTSTLIPNAAVIDYTCDGDARVMLLMENSTATLLPATPATVLTSMSSSPVSVYTINHVNAIIHGTIGALSGTLFLLLVLLLWIHRLTVLRICLRLVGKEEQSISPFVTGITDTQADTNVPRRTEEIETTGPTSWGAPFTQRLRLKRAEAEAQARNAQELCITREALSVICDEHGSREEITTLHQSVAELLDRMRRLEENEGSPPEYGSQP
ncbi:hypothetical protein BDP27DRAFT_1372487 [Rhodocollybia butyracea]|uniref:Transmembrane protein n=1 Tax=Rhodocollybia butyracea TaxID=206335 RepID=A0A9P5PAE3_9AGAR|nr:hypothetical protein BDP27DRAFT_1372487 [Rhodocollybia butyracea]